jgi:TetR/AcrR family transcriptional regulator of autoinduction and epiphytic fitness
LKDDMAAPDNAGRRERKRSRTLDHLAATAFALFEAQGYDAVTMEQVAAAADVAKGTLYNHFPVKEALLAHWIHGELAAHLELLAADVARRKRFAPRIWAVLEAAIVWCEGHRAYLPHYLRFRFLEINAAALGEAGVTSSGVDRLFEAAIESSQRSGELRKDLSAAHLATLFNHLYLGALMRWLTVPGSKLEAEFAAIVRLFVAGAEAPRKPLKREAPPKRREAVPARSGAKLASR